MEYAIEDVIREFLTEKLKGRKLYYDSTTDTTQFYFGGTRWTWLTDEHADTATHEVVSAKLSFNHHYCPSDTPCSYDPGHATYEISIVVRDLIDGKETTRYGNMDALPSS